MHVNYLACVIDVTRALKSSLETENTSQHATETGTRLSGIQRIKTNLVLWSELLHFAKNFTKNGALAWAESDTSCVVTVLAYR